MNACSSKEAARKPPTCGVHVENPSPTRFPSSALLRFFLGRVPLLKYIYIKKKTQKTGTLILSSLLKDLAYALPGRRAALC